MEHLEDIALIEPQIVQPETEVKTYQEKSKSYEGLVLLEVKPYKGGTSIKYWM